MIDESAMMKNMMNDEKLIKETMERKITEMERNIDNKSHELESVMVMNDGMKIHIETAEKKIGKICDDDGDDDDIDDYDCY